MISPKTTPAELRAFAEDFDSPNKAPLVMITVGVSPDTRGYTAGYLLRRIADSYEEALNEQIKNEVAEED